MPTTHGEIVINADPALIMKVIGDLEAYPEWSDGVTGAAIIEADDLGRPLKASLDFSSGPIKDHFELEYKWEGNEKVTWWLTSGKVLTKEDGSYTLTDMGNGDYKVVYDLEIDVSIKIPGILKKQAEKKIVKTALEGLKKRVESLK